VQQINFKKFKYWQFQYELIFEKELTLQQGVVYSYLYNHCVNINQNGYCGYSDERMADDLKLQGRTFQRELKALKDKGLIGIKNPQKRTKKTGESRMIYINSANYLVEVQMSLSDIQNANLKRENEKLKARIAELEKNIQRPVVEEVKPNYWGVLLVKSGFMNGETYMADSGFYNSLLTRLYDETSDEWIRKAIKYFALQGKKTNIENHQAYLARCVEDSILGFQHNLMVAEKNEELQGQLFLDIELD